MKYLAILSIVYAQLLFAEDLSDLKKNDFSNSLMGLNWGDDISDDILSKTRCAADPSSIEILPKWNTSDWCKTLQGQSGRNDFIPTGVLCAKKVWPQKPRTFSYVDGKRIDDKNNSMDGVEYCYTGSNTAYRDQPSGLVALYLIDSPSKKIEKVPNVDSEDESRFELFPVGFEGVELIKTAVPFKATTQWQYKGTRPTSIRYLISVIGKLIGFASSSEVPEKLDPKYFLIQSEQKYGAATTKLTFKKPLQDRYTDCWIWNNKNDRFAQVTCIIPRSLSQSDIPKIDTVFIEKKTLIGLAKKAEAKNEAVANDAKTIDLDYSVTMAKDYLATDKPEKALVTIQEGLGQDSSNTKLLELKAKAQKIISDRKMLIALSEADHKNKEIQKAKDKIALRQEEDRKTKAEVLRQRPELQQAALCDCQNQKNKAAKIIQDEQIISSHSGVVDKIKLYDAGKSILNINKTISHIRSKMSQEKIGLAACPERKISSDSNFSCSTYFINNSKEITELNSTNY